MLREATAPAVAALAALLALGSPSVVEAGPGRSDPTEERSVGRLAQESLEELLRRLEDFLRSVPLYQAPEITEDGDIIIRRAPREPEAAPPEGPIDDSDVVDT
jgi:hypothetical protein